MSTTITALPTASGIDGSADWLAIDRTSLGVTQKINRQTFLGVTGTPADLSTAQTFTNKIIGNTNTITAKDGSFTLQNTADATKQAVFSLAGITTATTRTLTLPNASVTLASLSGIETFTNKTLTSPVISGGSIDNSTITVDSIAGHTSSTIVSVAGLSISSGVLNTANAVTATSIADGAIQPKALTTGTGSGWSWASWTPTFTNLTSGNGVLAARYIQVGKTVFFRIGFVLGTTSAVSGEISFTLPVTAVTYNTGTGNNTQIGTAWIDDAGVANYQGSVLITSTTQAALRVSNAAGTYLQSTSVSSTIPMTWGTSDAFGLQGYYEAA
jgi:hypothetical protein